VVELVYTRDLKSLAQKACGFESHLSHQSMIPTFKSGFYFGDRGLEPVRARVSSGHPSFLCLAAMAAAKQLGQAQDYSSPTSRTKIDIVTTIQDNYCIWISMGVELITIR
jgi:hypothetical protein